MDYEKAWVKLRQELGWAVNNKVKPSPKAWLQQMEVIEKLMGDEQQEVRDD